MLAKVCGAALQGIDAIRISIETLVEPGFSITLVGMPDKAVKESIQRVESAVNHSALEFPRRKILINMAPAEVRKEGAAYDLPLAVGRLADGAAALSRAPLRPHRHGHRVPPLRAHSRRCMGQVADIHLRGCQRPAHHPRQRRLAPVSPPHILLMPLRQLEKRLLFILIYGGWK